ncbi:MAG: hypothetical protein J5544_06565 [Clostridia bacterium]|nr:hypothetical protein [Clostridia bacterium]
MTQVLGLELEKAAAILESEGFLVETVEARSLKGVEGADSKRVIRQLLLEGRDVPTVQLVYSGFKTAVDITA